MDKLTTREKKFIVGSIIFLASAILYFYNLKSSNIFFYSIFFGIGLFTVLFAWINFNIKKKVILKIGIILFLLRLASFSLLLSHFGIVVISFFFTWITFVIFDYVKSLDKSVFVKILSFIFMVGISYFFFKFVPLIVIGFLFGFD